MVSTNAVTGTGTTLFDPPATAKEKTQTDEFLQLFVAELQNQNPMEPQKGSEFISQLATLTQVQQSAETNSHLIDMQTQAASNTRANYISLVGRRVSVHSADFEKPLPTGAKLTMSLPRAAKNVEVHILDADGNRVRTIDLGARGAGDTAIEWDGLDDGKRGLPNGKYRVEVAATDAQGSSMDAATTLSGVISELRFQNGSAQFSIGGVAVSPGDILSIGT